MNIAVVGAGFSGLSICYHLLQHEGCSVSLFDEKGIGGGASGVSSGLLHPYPALDGKPSWNAAACLQESKELIETIQRTCSLPLADYSGILRYALSTEQELRFRQYPDMEKISDQLFLIRSGITVYARRYLHALWDVCRKKNAELYVQKIHFIEELHSFDAVVLAAGWGMRTLLGASPLKLNFTKGQRLRCRAVKPVRSAIGKGYLSVCDDPQFFEIGSTYERDFESALACKETATELLKPQIDFFHPEAHIEECLSGVRVSRTGQYLPLAEKIHKNCYVLTAMGSRGLLYHAYFGRQMAQTLISGLRDE